MEEVERITLTRSRWISVDGSTRVITYPEDGADHEEEHPHAEPQQAWSCNQGGPSLDRQRFGTRVKHFMAKSYRAGDPSPNNMITAITKRESAVNHLCGLSDERERISEGMVALI